MNHRATLAAAPLWGLLLVGGTSSVATAQIDAKLVGIAFVDSSVTGQGSRAKLPDNAVVHPIGSTIKGTTGCPTTRYRTDGLIVAVIDYAGRPTSASVTITEHRADGTKRARAPYHLNLNPGRVLQFLGPIFENGTYHLELETGLAQKDPVRSTGQFVLDRNCAPGSDAALQGSDPILRLR